MTFEPVRTYRLVEKGGAGLACDAQGVVLGGVPLAWAQDGDNGALKWRVRSPGEVADILTTAYGPQPSAAVDRCHRGLRRIAEQFETGDLALAGIEALMLRLPPIDPVLRDSLKRRNSSFPGPDRMDNLLRAHS